MNLQLFGALGISIIAASPLFAQIPYPPTAPGSEQASPQSSTVFQTPALTPANNQSPPAPPPPPATLTPAPNPAYQGPAPSSDSTGLVPPNYVPSRPVGGVIAEPEPYHIWVTAEALVWWVKNAPLPVPIAVVTDAGGNSQTVIGNSTTDFGAFSGGRFALGAWFDRNNIFGFETSFFALERRTNSQSVSDDGNGNPALGLSYYSTTPGSTGEYIQPVSSPGTYTGSILVDSKLETWGAEVNGALCILRTANLEFTALAGFRYVDLEESLNINSFTSQLSSGNFWITNDNFSTRNQFYGGQFGARLVWSMNRLSLDATGKIALGATNQVVDIQGSSYSSVTGNVTTGGFYALPSNIGHYTANQFGVVPSLDLKLSYRFFRTWQAFIGYDFMYWNQVVRPGDQIDRNIGPTSPSPLFNRSDFWAQGMTFGLELKF